MSTALLIGNSDGIGHALTLQLLSRGWTVVGISRSQSSVQHERYRHLVADVSIPMFGSALHDAHEEGAFDACIYCAGIGHKLNLEDLSREELVFDVNLLGLVRTVEVVVPAMVRAGGGRLIALSSLADVLVLRNAPSYSASKSGLSNYLKGLHLALKTKNVSVTNIRFGFVDTKMAQSSVKPLMISPERAAEVVLRALEKPRATVTSPRLAGLAVAGLRLLLFFQLLWA